MAQARRGLRGRALALGTACSLGLLAVPAAGSDAAPAAPTGSRGEPTIGPLHSGTTAYVDGTFVWTDYAYDDHGANTSPGAAGAASYPDPQDQANAADLIQLQAQLDRSGGLRLTAVLETLTRRDEPLLGIGFDSDLDTSTGAPSVPGGRWAVAGPLGLDYFVTASADGGSLLRWSAGGWRPIRSLPHSVDTDDNTITTTVPRGVLPATGRLSAVALLGLRREAASWLTGKGEIYDLGFVVAEPPAAGGGMLVSAQIVAVTGQGHATGGAWQDIRQADVLAGRLPASRATATLDLEAMRAGATRVPRLDTPGYHTMMYRSHVSMPEGIVEGTAGGGLWAGPYQPYLVQVPNAPPQDRPVLLYLHGGGGTHLDNGAFAPQGQLSIGPSLAVFPYGRSPTTSQDHGYHGVGEQDVLDVLADVKRHYATDPDRTVVAGISTGGGGAFRMAQLHPDLFSGVLVISAFDDTHVPENLINLPVVMHNGGADPAISPPVVALTQAELDRVGNVGYRSYTAAAHSHGDPTGPIAQCLLDGLLRHRVARDPARVVLARDPHNDPPGLPAGTDLQHDRAYWLSGVQIRPGAPGSVWHPPAGGDPPAYGDNAVARIDVTSNAYAVRTVVATPVEELGQNVTAGATMCGPDSSTKTGDVWRVHGIDLSPGGPLPTANSATLHLRQVSAARLDLNRMRLSTRKPLTLSAQGDGGTTLTLVGPWPESRPVRVVVDGVTSYVQPRGRRLGLTLDLTGTHTIVLSPR